MKRISLGALGLAVGLSFTFLYLGSIVFLALTGEGGAIIILPSITNVESETIIETTPSLLEMILGSVGSFLLGWLIGISVAAFYNAFTKKSG